ncbi:MAG: OmpA family protein [Myxococcota bacterium]
MSRAVVVFALWGLSAAAQPALASAREQWLLNPGAEHSQVVGTGALLGAGGFRVSLQTHLFADAATLQLREHLLVAVAPLERLQLLAQAPVVLLQRPAPAPEQGVGRPFVGARFGILSPRWDDFAWLSVEAQVGIPGLEQAEPATRTLLPTGVVKLSGGVPSGTRGAFGLELGSRFGAGLVEVGGGLTFAGQGIHLGGELSLQGSVSMLGTPRGFVELLGGVRYRLRPVELSLVGGPGYGLVPGQLSGRVVFGLSFVNPSEPDEPEAPREVRPDCTDGTAYRLEACPDLDWDHDGVPNGADRCPREPGEKENQGCPWPDRDGDGTTDPFDNCPDEPGPPNNAGCPKEQPQKVVIRKDRLEILEVIFFEFDKAIIKPESFGLLEQVAKVLNGHPELVHVRIEGHTDRVGSASYNRELSLARANAVKTFLVERGQVAGERLSTRGFGFDRPIASNDDEAGRAQNRRVEFLIVGTVEDAAE